MTDQVDTGAAGADEEVEPKRTQYVVEIARDGVDERVLWEHVGWLNVPRRTQRATVLNRAGVIAAEYATNKEMPTPVRFRVMPEAEVLEGDADLEVPPPRLKVTPR